MRKTMKVMLVAAGLTMGGLTLGNSAPALAAEVSNYSELVTKLAEGEDEITLSQDIFLEGDVFLERSVTIDGETNCLYAGNYQINGRYVMEAAANITLRNIEIMHTAADVLLDVDGIGAQVTLDRVTYDGPGMAVSADNGVIKLAEKGNDLCPDYTSGYVKYVLSGNEIVFAEDSHNRVGFITAKSSIEARPGSVTDVISQVVYDQYPVNSDGNMTVSGAGTQFNLQGVGGGIKVSKGAFTVSDGAIVKLNSDGSKLPAGYAQSLLYAKNISVKGAALGATGASGKLILNANGTQGALNCIGLDAGGMIDINGGGFDFKQERKTSPLIMRQAGTSVLRIRNGGLGVQGWLTSDNVNNLTTGKIWRLDAGQTTLKANVTFYAAAGAGIPYSTVITGSSSTTFKNEFQLKQYARLSNLRFIK